VCFIYLEPTDTAPLYAFSLVGLKPEIEDPKHPDKESCTVSPAPAPGGRFFDDITGSNQSREGLITVLLRQKKTGKIAHQFTFDTKRGDCDPGTVKKFVDVVVRNGSAADSPVQGTVVSGQAKGDTGKSGVANK